MDNTQFLTITIVIIISLLLIISPTSFAGAPRKLVLIQPEPTILKYHNGDLLKGNITVNLLWYGNFKRTQHAILVDFIESLTPAGKSRQIPPSPSVASWWSTTQKYMNGTLLSTITLGKQIFYSNYYLGKSLTEFQIRSLTKKHISYNTVNVVLTAADVEVEDFCMNSCGSHGRTRGIGERKYPYSWVGNSVSQCPGQCAWPFHKPLMGPQTKPLVAPNGDVGIDGMVINLATVLAGTVTNPFGEGYFQGPATAPLEAVSACTGMFGSGSYPGYTGKVMVDKKTGGSYNAQGRNERKYLIPGMWDPETEKCQTLI